jgi:hypothetical protein
MLSNTVGPRTAPSPTPIPIPRTIVRYGSWPPSRTVGTFGSVSTSPGVKKVKYATARMTAMTNIVSTNLIIPPLAFCSVSVMPSTTWIRRRSSPAGHTSRLPRGDPCSRSKVFHRNSRSALYFYLQKEHRRGKTQRICFKHEWRSVVSWLRHCHRQRSGRSPRQSIVRWP